MDHSQGYNYVTFGYNTAGERVWKEHEYWHWTSGGGGPLGAEGTGGSLLLGDSLLGGGFETLGGPGGGGGWYIHTNGTYYVRSGGKVLAEYSSLTGSPSFKFIYAGEQRIAMIDGNGYMYFYMNDHLGSARQVWSENGWVREAYTYWAFGASRYEAIGVNQAYRYTGKPFDDDEGLDLYYYGARYYDPATGRFLAVDPTASKYPGWGPYVYTLNNPLKYVDPDGREVYSSFMDMKGDGVNDFQQLWGAKGDIGLGLAIAGIVATPWPFDDIAAISALAGRGALAIDAIEFGESLVEYAQNPSTERLTLLVADGIAKFGVEKFSRMLEAGIGNLTTAQLKAVLMELQAAGEILGAGIGNRKDEIVTKDGVYIVIDNRGGARSGRSSQSQNERDGYGSLDEFQ